MTFRSTAQVGESLDVESLNLFQKILMVTDGTVTDLIGLYTGEQITVKKIEQSVQVEPAPAVLACAAGERLLHRKILLSGTRHYLYADSIFVVERLSPSIQAQLLETDRPIGLMWKMEKLETYREIIARHVGPCAEIAGYFDLRAESVFASRTYLIHHRGRPLGMITEKWPTSLFCEVRI